MVDIRLPASGSLRIRWGLPNAFVNEKSPTVAEANACLDIADAVSWNDYDFGVSSSTINSDPAVTAKGNVQDRGATQYGGSMSFYYPRVRNDVSNIYSIVENVIDVPRTVGYLLISIDGDLSTNNVPTYTGGATRNFADGDFAHVFKVMTAGYGESITGEEAFRYTVSFLPQGVAETYIVIRTAAATVVVTPTTQVLAVGAVAALSATVQGRRYTRGLRWTSSNAALVQVSQNGIVKRIAAGSATITATYTQTGANATATLT
jgi:uncharacterized protein YjdB